MNNKTTNQQSSQPTSQSKQSESSQIGSTSQSSSASQVGSTSRSNSTSQGNSASQSGSTWQNLAEREDFAGQTYRTIRDYPKTSAAIATGVAAAAGAGAFLLNRKKKVGTAFGHASSSDKIVSEVEQINKKGVSDAKA